MQWFLKLLQPNWCRLFEMISRHTSMDPRQQKASLLRIISKPVSTRIWSLHSQFSWPCPIPSFRGLWLPRDWRVYSSLIKHTLLHKYDLVTVHQISIQFASSLDSDCIFLSVFIYLSFKIQLKPHFSLKKFSSLKSFQPMLSLPQKHYGSSMHFFLYI